MKLGIYTLESCAAALLQLRVPHVPQRQLAAWFAGGPAGGSLTHLYWWVCVGGGLEVLC